MKQIIIHPCKNQAQIIDIAKNYVSDTPLLKCKSIGYHGLIAIMKDSKFVGTVSESTKSIIFKGVE